MATKTIAWTSGTGNITVTYDGSGDGTAVIISSDNDLYEARSQEITLRTTAGSPQVTKKVTITQAARVRTDISAAVVTAANQTYSGSALTPTPTVVLNGTTIPSSGYDVTYSNNTNAGSATITVTGKGDYTGTATGTFTINQATGQVTTLPTARSVTYTGSAQYLVTAGSGTGTMQYRYKLSTSSTWSSWSTTRARSTNAGTYNVQYRAAASADGNYTVSDVGELNVTIAKANRTIAFTTAPTSVEIGATITVVATPSAGASDGTITYASSDTSKASVSGNVVTGVALGSCTISATISGGSNYNDATTSYSLGVTEKNYANEYFTIESLEDGNAIVWKCAGTGNSIIYWSSDKASWAVVTPSTSGTTITTINKEQKIYIRRTGDAVASSGSNYCYFSTSKKYVVSGNIMSLIKGDSFANTNLTSSNSYAFAYLFYNSSSLISAEHLVLPNSTCSHCYYYMFRSCTGLSVAPKMPATTLSESCYYGTYYGCSSLITAPKLPATTLTRNCCAYMFSNCSQLSYIQCLATDISATNCTNQWLSGVASTGTFVKPSSMSSWATGASGIPSGWSTATPISSHVEIEYLQSTGTQYIDTSANAAADKRFEVDAQFTSTANAQVGTGNTASTNKAFVFGIYGSKWIFRCGGNSTTTGATADTSRHTFSVESGTGKVDSTTYSVAAYSGSTDGDNIWLFGRNNNGTINQPASMKIYSAKIYKSDVLVMDLVPVRSGTTGYLYDKISERYFSNRGTGSFTLGADI